jgi:ABC-2 type transport system ATP-binding protein
MIQVEALTKYYDDFCAVDGISLEIPKGQILGLLGPNGAGKTTTLRMLTGYLQPSAGRIRIKSMDVVEQPVAVKGLIGYLPESAPLYPGMLVYDYLAYIAAIRRLHGSQRQARIHALVGLCGLQEIMHKTIGELSKGLKQRVGLAHAMMSDPEILVLDEPTSGLDPNQIVEIRDIIRGVGKEKTVILSTHILSEAEATCNRIVIIHRGRIAADDETEQLKLTAGGMGQINLTLTQADPEAARRMLSALPGVIRVTAQAEGDTQSLSLEVRYRPETDPRAAIYNAIKQTDWILLALVPQTRNLENVFRELTKEA